MLNLSELLFLLVGYIIRSEQDAGLESVELELGSILNNFAVIDWVCSARAQWKQKVSKTDAYASTLNFSSSLIDKVRGGDSMASFASLNSTTLFEPTAKTEENLLELWMAHIGDQQVKQLIEFIPLNFKVIKYICSLVLRIITNSGRHAIFFVNDFIQGRKSSRSSNYLRNSRNDPAFVPTKSNALISGLLIRDKSARLT